MSVTPTEMEAANQRMRALRSDMAAAAQRFLADPSPENEAAVRATCNAYGGFGGSRMEWHVRTLRATAAKVQGQKPCERCGGSGQYGHYGVCYDCGGDGVAR